LRINEIAALLPQDGMKPLKDYVRLLKEEMIFSSHPTSHNH